MWHYISWVYGERGTPSCFKTSFLILQVLVLEFWGIYKELYKELKQKSPKNNSEIDIVDEYPLGYFDGKTQNGKWVSGVWLQLSSSHCFLI